MRRPIWRALFIGAVMLTSGGEGRASPHPQVWVQGHRDHFVSEFGPMLNIGIKSVAVGYIRQNISMQPSALNLHKLVCKECASYYCDAVRHYEVWSHLGGGRTCVQKRPRLAEGFHRRDATEKDFEILCRSVSAIGEKELQRDDFRLFVFSREGWDNCELRRPYEGSLANDVITPDKGGLPYLNAGIYEDRQQSEQANPVIWLLPIGLASAGLCCLLWGLPQRNLRGFLVVVVGSVLWISATVVTCRVAWGHSLCLFQTHYLHPHSREACQQKRGHELSPCDLITDIDGSVVNTHLVQPCGQVFIADSALDHLGPQEPLCLLSPFFFTHNSNPSHATDAIIGVTFVVDNGDPCPYMRYSGNANGGNRHVPTLPPFPGCQDPHPRARLQDDDRGSRVDVRAHPLAGDERRAAGKACAQAAHAANLMVQDAVKDTGGYMFEMWKQWCGNHGFGTTIVLSGGSLSYILQQRAGVKGHMRYSGSVVDYTYPLTDGTYVHRIPVITCAYLFGHRNTLTPFISGLSLYP